ncbi:MULTISPECIES: hypothetical protein [Photorhabdus]|uniref:Uncharacterized protein n=1 Tax=Photorhabdus asymbiotica subsp. asymbiotica (strain ATCC 43949 / 3105-77) TaxID=553480 RepID=C7BHZ0_PHOAA|nr:hypothetical protein [Photorhabdus asymbiotica]CAQ85332.1 conserved hypothetical protein [Photorhabdus asymbiotica]
MKLASGVLGFLSISVLIKLITVSLILNFLSTVSSTYVVKTPTKSIAPATAITLAPATKKVEKKAPVTQEAKAPTAALARSTAILPKKSASVYTLHPSSCCFVGCVHSPQSHSYLCSWGFIHLPPRCNSKSIGYIHP